MMAARGARRQPLVQRNPLMLWKIVAAASLAVNLVLLLKMLRWGGAGMSFAPRSTLGQIPSGVWVLGFISLLMDISPEMIHSLLPLFMVTTLSASALVVGLIEGWPGDGADGQKVFSGGAQRLSRQAQGWRSSAARWALTKPVFALASAPASSSPRGCSTASAGRARARRIFA